MQVGLYLEILAVKDEAGDKVTGLEEMTEEVVVIMVGHYTAHLLWAQHLPQGKRGESFKHQAVPSIYRLTFW